jgi:haloacid dehalogenase superfamily, subfamily IA, variant 3 with third motif having DD or ED
MNQLKEFGGISLIKYIIFDLSEVLICGILGIENKLCEVIPLSPNDIIDKFGGDILNEICLGNITEDYYLESVINKEGWKINKEFLKSVIRKNFHTEIQGSIELLSTLGKEYKLVLLSDNAKEWISYIEGIHPFLELFNKKFYSYELNSTKKNAETFVDVLRKLSVEPDECLFIDDSINNIRIAKSVGVQSIHFSDIEKLKKDLNNVLVSVS